MAPRRVGLVGLSAVLAGAMALSMTPGPIIGILSRFFIDDLGLTRTEIGAVATFHAFAIMITSIPLGVLADRLSGRYTQVLMLSFVFLGLLTMAFSWDLWSLLVFVAIAGLPAAGANSATNNIIVENVPAGSRGWITGIKQSGVQIGILAAGLALPVTATRLGWRMALVLASLVALAGIAATLAIVPSGPAAWTPARNAGERGGRLPGAVRWISAYGVTMGIGVGTYAAFVPLYAQENLGMGVALAGTVIAVSGASGALWRVVWGRIAERAAHPSVPLVAIGALSASAFIATWMAPYTTPYLIWVGAVLVGMSTGSWMSVGMMAAIMLSEPKQTGHSTGSIVLGFAVGLTIGPVVFGWGVDTFGSYDLPWAGVTLNFAAAMAMMVLWRFRARSEETAVGHVA
ncbi:MAG: MFS transporter [Acidimicrobiia bacterium]|nr:MFS transporter [Acidimicrobiia bacterium]